MPSWDQFPLYDRCAQNSALPEQRLRDESVFSVKTTTAPRRPLEFEECFQENMPSSESELDPSSLQQEVHKNMQHVQQPPPQDASHFQHPQPPAQAQVHAHAHAHSNPRHYQCVQPSCPRQQFPPAPPLKRQKTVRRKRLISNSVLIEIAAHSYFSFAFTIEGGGGGGAVRTRGTVDRRLQKFDNSLRHKCEEAPHSCFESYCQLLVKHRTLEEPVRLEHQDLCIVRKTVQPLVEHFLHMRVAVGQPLTDQEKQTIAEFQKIGSYEYLETVKQEQVGLRSASDRFYAAYKAFSTMMQQAYCRSLEKTYSSSKEVPRKPEP